MKNKLVMSIRRRIGDEIGPRSRDLKYLKDVAVEDYVDVTISTVYLYTRKKKSRLGKGKNVPLYEMISAIGHKVRSHLGLKRNSAVAAKTGAFLLYSFEEMAILHVELGNWQIGL
jgi:hypothetical protein